MPSFFILFCKCETFTLLRDTDGKAERNLFKSMNLDYVFVKDGNDLESLINAFERVKDTDKPYRRYLSKA